jgi:lipoprotein-anchoring transpeptidase ErfK/SrfK/outer membrane biosynthesis protein TonB
LVVLLLAFVVIYLEADDLKAWWTGQSPALPPETAATGAPPGPASEEAPPLPAPKPVAPPKPEVTDEQRHDQFEKQANAETAKLIQPVAPVVTPPPPPPPKPAVTLTTNPVPALPPVAQPETATSPSGVPARALPLDPNKLDTERIAAYQVALERMHFSCGFIDGDQGMRTQRMLRAYQTSHGLPVTGFLDQPTRDAIGEPGEPFLSYTVTADDIASIMPKPTSWKAKAKATRLGYNDMWEMLAEKFHCTRAYLKALNRDITTFTPGADVIGPKVYPAAPIPKAASLRIILSETSIEALDASGKIIAFFPCSIAKDKNKRPNGVLTVKSVVPNPDYTFDPALFADDAKAEGITKKMVLPPGPRNPVGTAWVGLSLPGYGIHGTPAPEMISATQSHGCFRLANWNADKVLKMVKVGTPVDVQP